jgi:hypothetical protein
MFYFSATTSEYLVLVIEGRSAPLLDAIVEFVDPATGRKRQIRESFAWTPAIEFPPGAIRASIVGAS